MITEFKLYENTLEVEQLQLCKLAILKFTKKVSEVFDLMYNINGYEIEPTKIKLVEEENTRQNNITSYKLIYRGETLLSLSIKLDKKIHIQFNLLGWKTYYQFMLHFLNRDSERYVHNFTFTYDELNKMSDEIVDEYELYTNIKKYNL